MKARRAAIMTAGTGGRHLPELDHRNLEPQDLDQDQEHQNPPPQTPSCQKLAFPKLGIEASIPDLKGGSLKDIGLKDSGLKDSGFEGRHDVGETAAMGGEEMVYMNIFSRERGFRMTSHALERSQQRCIPPLIIHWLCQYGSRKRSLNGTIVCYFDKKSVRLLTSDVGKVVIRRLSSLMNAYLVTAGDQIVTVGHRYKRIRNC